jgi:hypothetical protein
MPGALSRIGNVRPHRGASPVLDGALGCETSTMAESNRSCVNAIQLADSVGPMHSD